MTPTQALTAFARSRPRLAFVLYSDRTAYAQDARKVQGQLRRFNASLETARALGVTDSDILAAAPRAFSGRLTFAKVANRGPSQKTGPRSTYRIDYCTGQYYPTEYRAAACAVLEQAISDARQRNPPQDQDLPTTVQEAKDRNRDAGGHYFDRDTCRFFGSRFHGMPFAGCLIESAKPPHGSRFYRPVFVRADGSTWRPYPSPEFPTAARARKEAWRMNEHNEIKWKE